jgi:hypothetical protein
MTRDTALRANTRREYSMQEHGHSEVGQRQGQHVCKPLVDYWTLAYGEGKTTTIRILPGLNPEYNPQDANSSYWDPYRLAPYSTQTERSWGDWIRRYSAVKMGDPAVSFIIADPTQTSAQDIQMTPAWILFNAIDRAVANKQEQQGWAGMLRGGTGRRAQLSRPSEIYVVQAFLAGYGAKTYWPPKGYATEDKTLVVGLSTSAGESMIAEMNRLKEGYQGDPYDYENSMVNGDPISLDYGRWVTFYTLADGDPRQRNQQQASGWNAAPQRSGGGGRQNDPIGYGAFLETHFGPNPSRLREVEQAVYQKVKPWRDVLHFPTIEEQAALLADKFPPDAIAYAWRDHDDWIPEAVKRRLRGAVSFGGVAMHGVQGYGPQGLMPPVGPMPPQQGWGQLPPPPPTDMGAPQGMPAAQGWAAPPAMPPQAAPPSQMAPPPAQAAPGFGPPGMTGVPGQGGLPPVSAAFGPPQPAPGYPPQAAPQGFPPQAAPGYPPQAAPGFPPQVAPPGFQPQPTQQGFPPQAAPGYPPQAAPQGFPPQAAPQGFPPQAAPGYPPQAAPPGFQPQQQPQQPQQPAAAPGWGAQPQQQQPQQPQPTMAWGAQGNSAVDTAVPTGMPPGAPMTMPPQQMQPQQMQPQQQFPQPAQNFAPPAGQFPGQPPTGYAQPPGVAPPQNGAQPTRAAAALAAATAAAQQYQQPPQQ